MLRAAISGASGTPYQDGMFVFDIFLPPSYPGDPPEAYYHSFGMRVNPNLYENGKVCLSLLNTWSGREGEVWDPATSTLLQVLVSIQGLVLVPKPYYNEAGYERQTGSAEGEKNARVYNESAYLLVLKSMLAMLRRPQAGFEPLVRAHFRARRAHILRACAHYAAGVRVGSLDDDAEPVKPKPGAEGGACEAGPSSAPAVDERSSEGFRIILAKIVPKLEAAFAAL